MSDAPKDAKAFGGDPTRHVALVTLSERSTHVRARAPLDHGVLALIVRRAWASPGEMHPREVLDRTTVTPDGGIPMDAWSQGRGGSPPPDAQLAVMQLGVAELVANGQPLTLFGDNLFLDLDLSAENLPVGSRLRVGDVAIFEVTPKPHNGCKKFQARFGDGALRFVSAKETRSQNLRGVYLQVVVAGEIGVGDPVTVLSRALT